MKPIIGALLFCFIIPFCSKQKSEPRNVTIRYSTGSVYCSGFLQESDDGDSIRVGQWRFYFPDSNLHKRLEYDDFGIVVRREEYSETRELLYSGSKNGNTYTITEFFDNGRPYSEILIETSGEDESGPETRFIKEYYTTGQLRSELRTVDGELDGLERVWDRSGNLVLELTYRNGLIK